MTDNNADLLPIAPNVITPEQRFTVLMDFAASPESDKVWERAFAMVRADDTVPEGEGYETLAEMPAEDLIALIKHIRATPSPERYSILTQPISPDQVAFDAFPTFTSPQIRRAMSAALQELTARGWAFRRALEIGTATGNSIHVLEAAADEVVGIDRHESLLNIARQRIRNPKTSLQVADALSLPFEPGSFDLIASTGLLASMNSEKETAFWQEMSRMLIPGQIYMDGWWQTDEYPGIEMLRTVQSSKAMIADMAVDITAGNRAVDNDRLPDHRRRILLAHLGMREYTEDVLDPVANDGSATRLRMVMKLPPPDQAA